MQLGGESGQLLCLQLLLAEQRLLLLLQLVHARLLLVVLGSGLLGQRLLQLLNLHGVLSGQLLGDTLLSASVLVCQRGLLGVRRLDQRLHRTLAVLQALCGCRQLALHLLQPLLAVLLLLAQLCGVSGVSGHSRLQLGCVGGQLLELGCGSGQLLAELRVLGAVALALLGECAHLSLRVRQCRVLRGVLGGQSVERRAQRSGVEQQQADALVRLRLLLLQLLHLGLHRAPLGLRLLQRLLARLQLLLLLGQRGLQLHMLAAGRLLAALQCGEGGGQALHLRLLLAQLGRHVHHYLHRAAALHLYQRQLLLGDDQHRLRLLQLLRLRGLRGLQLTALCGGRLQLCLQLRLRHLRLLLPLVELSVGHGQLLSQLHALLLQRLRLSAQHVVAVFHLIEALVSLLHLRG